MQISRSSKWAAKPHFELFVRQDEHLIIYHTFHGSDIPSPSQSELLLIHDLSHTGFVGNSKLKNVRECC